jgi:hypothetical protein
VTLTAFFLASILLASDTTPFTASAHVRGVSAEAEYEAIQQALARALTEAVGTWVSDPRPWEAALERDVFSRRAQYVSEYAVVSGSDNPDGTGLRREVRVVVEMPELAHTLVDLGLLYYASSGGRAAVVVDAPGDARGGVQTALVQWLRRWGLDSSVIEAGSQESLAGLVAKAGAGGARCLLLVRGEESAAGRVQLEGVVVAVPGGDELTRGTGEGSARDAVSRLTDAWGWRPATTGSSLPTLPADVVVDGYGTEQAGRHLASILALPGVAAPRAEFASGTGAGASVGWCGTEVQLESTVRQLIGAATSAELKNGVLHVLPLTVAARSDVAIVSFRVEDLFPASLRYYQQHPPAALQVINRSPSETEIAVAVRAAGFTSIPSRRAWGRLGPGDEKEGDFLLPLDVDKVLAVTQDTPLQAEALVTYGTGEAKATAMATVHRRSAVDWANLPSVCAFVNPREPTAQRVASLASALSAPGDRLPGRLDAGMRIWTYATALGLVYRADPGVPAGDVYDDVHFPTETLLRGGGDCEDLSVLLAACFEAAGIPSMLLVTSNHVLLAFDTGLTEKNARLISLDRQDVLVKSDHVWLPLESTVVGEDFLRAWESGARRCRDIMRNDGTLELVIVEDGWATYPPLSPGFPDTEGRLPGTAEMGPAWNEAVDAFRDRWSAQLTAELSRLDADREARPEPSTNERGILLALAGRLDEAEASFRSVGGTSWSANNRANVRLLMGDADGAILGYRSALEIEDDGGIWTNVALAYYAAAAADGDSLSIEMLAEAMARAGGEAQVRRLLGIGVFEEGGDTRAAAAQKVSREELLRLLAAAKGKVPATVAERPRTVHVLAARKALGPEELQELLIHLYWKEPAG